MAELDLAIDEQGAPVLRLAGAVRVITPESGNPNREIGSGRFGRGRRQAQAKRRQVDQQSRGSQERRRDAVVDAARTIEDLSAKGVEAFVRRRWRGDMPLTREIIEQFAADARRQRFEDVLDALDARLRKGTEGPLSRGKSARVSFPRGWLRRSLRGMEDSEVQALMVRLRGRGWSEESLNRYVIRPFRGEVRRGNAERAAS
jgi:hypothetical protein